MAERVRIVDVARASGFSTSTVSLVLNEAALSRYVASTTKEHIRAVAAKLGYRPDVSARSLRSRRSQTIGIMVSDISDPFCTLILEGIEKTLSPTSYLPIIMIAQNGRKQFERHVEMLMERRVEGVILVANWLFAEFDQLSVLDQANIPTIAVGRDLTARGVDSVQVDNDGGGYAAARHLYELGHRDIAVLLGPSELSDSYLRWSGIQRFASDNGLSLSKTHVKQLARGIEPTAGFDEGLRLTSEWIGQGTPFSAILAFDDLTAMGAIRALRQAGRRVPEDCSVIGFDDIPHAAMNTPGLTTIRQPMEEMGAFTARWVLGALDRDSHKPDRAQTGVPADLGNLHLMPSELVVRGSTAFLRD